MTEIEKLKEEIRLLTVLVMELVAMYSNNQYMQRNHIDSIMMDWERRRAELYAVEAKGGA